MRKAFPPVYAAHMLWRLSRRIGLPTILSLIVFWGIMPVMMGGCRDPIDYGNRVEETPTLILEIQSEHDDDEYPAVGSEVYLRSVVVTAYDTYSEPRQDRQSRGDGYVCVQKLGYPGTIVVQDYAGGEYGGVSLFNPTLVPAHETLGLGELVDVHGDYYEFCFNEYGRPDNYCPLSNTNRLTQIGNATVSRVGEAIAPEPMMISSTTLEDPNQAEPFEGLLVQVNENLQVQPCVATDPEGRPNCCVGDYDRYGNLRVGAILLSNEFYSIPEGTTCLTSVIGIVTWFYDYKISPRGPEDIVIPEECRSGAE